MSKRNRESACGSKELESPPFPFPPPGASRGHTATRCARAGESAGQKQSRWSRLRPVRKNAPELGAYAPLPPDSAGDSETDTLRCKADRSRVNKTGQLDVLTTGVLFGAFRNGESAARCQPTCGH